MKAVDNVLDFNLKKNCIRVIGSNVKSKHPLSELVRMDICESFKINGFNKVLTGILIWLKTFRFDPNETASLNIL